MGPMAVGATIGDAVRYSINNPEKESYEEPLYSLLGDPTLRLQTPRAPNGLEASRAGGVRLEWDASSEPGARYYVFRSSEGASGPYTPLNPSAPTTVTSFVDDAAPSDELSYLVKVSVLTTNASGSYFNLSVGSGVLVPAVE